MLFNTLILQRKVAMAILKDKEEEKGQGTSGVLGQPVPEQQQGMPQEQESSGPANIGGSSATQTSAPVKAMPKQQKAGTGTFANLKSYLQAAQGGGQQRVAQAAAGQVQRLGAGAQKATQQAQKTFGTQMGAGSGAVFQGAEPGKYLTAEEASGQAKADVSDIIGKARATTYQAPQPTIPKNTTPEMRINPPIPPQIKPYNPEETRLFWMDKVRNPDGTITYKDGTPLESTTPDKVRQVAEMTPEEKVSNLGITQPSQPQQYFTPEQTQRFADIINAQYQGPQSLQQAGLYDPAAQKARAAQQAGQLTQTALGREQLLRDVFGRQRDYGRGVSKLDALLLNASQQGVQQLQEQAQPALQAQQALQAAQNLSANEAAQRKAAIEQIRSGARGELVGARTQEEQAVEKRIDDLTKTPAVDEQGNKIPLLDSTGKQVVDAGGNPVFQTEWDRLPEYFRQSLANKATQTKTIQQEALAGLQTQFKPQIEAETQLSSQRNNLNKQLENIRTQIMKLGTPGLTGDSSRNESVYQAKRDELSQRASQISEQLKTVDSQLAGVKSTPEYQQYQKQLAQANAINANQWTLSPEEAAILGIQAGEGLYNIRPEDIQTAKAERERLITKDELSRQLALAQLAGTDISRELQKDLLYTDLEKAGTQDLTSSLDVDAFRRLLNEAQEGFKESAEGTTLTGYGKKTVSRGNISGTKKKTYYAQQQGNAADMLRQAGYDVSKLEPSEARSLLSNKDLLNRYLGATSTSRDEEGSNLDQVARDYAMQAALASNPATAPLAALKSTDTVQGLLEELGLGGVSESISDVRNIAASPFRGIGDVAGNNVVGDIFQGIGGAIGGIDAGEMRSHGTGKAKQIAIRDLQKKYEDYLKSQGFENRANIVDTETTRARSQALQDLLRRQG